MPLGWKTAQSKKNTDKKVKLALIVLSLVTGLILLSWLFKFGQYFFGQTKWNGDSNINIVLKSQSISLLSYNPKDEKITFIDIPDKTYLDVSEGFGSWQIGSVYPLGGGELLQKSLSSFFGVPIQGFLESDNFDSLTDKNPLSLLRVLSTLKTNLTPYEILRLKLGMSAVRFDKIKRINLEEAGLLDKDKLPDGTDILTSDNVKLDSLSNFFADPALKKERKTIAVFNSTSVPGLAQKAARLISNMGGEVIIVSNSGTELQKSAVLGEKSKTLDYLKQIFTSNGTIDPKLEDLVSSRAAINLFLGEDYFKNL